ncbi:MAG: hypothetical protein ACOH14_06465 [Rhodoglobus sp.]
MSGFSWIAVSATTGEPIADLPLLVVEKVKQSLGRYESAPATLPLPQAPENWDRATLQGATNMILLQDNPYDPAHGIPIWGGMVTLRTLSEGDTIPMTLATLEAYLDRRYVGDESFVQVGQNDIINTLITNYVAAGSNGGIPIRVEYVTSGAGKLRDREYKDQEDKTVYSALTDLAGILGGPEWTVGWEWQHSPERLTPVFYVGDRIGSAAQVGLGPAATFELPGSVSLLEMPQDYSNGKGANDVIATSSGQGDVRPQSPRQVIADPLRPTFEARFTPSTSITKIETLTDYAQTAVAALVDGTSSVSLSAVVGKGTPRLGVDWRIGDDVGFHIDSSVPAFPLGKAGVARAIGWELDLGATQSMTPILAGVEV